MIDLVIAADDMDEIRRQLLSTASEACAILYTSETRRTDGSLRLLVREVEFPTASDYERRSAIEAELTPHLVARVTKRARRESYGLVFVHSHGGRDSPTFSSVDSRGEARLAAFLALRHHASTHGALVVSAGGVRARRLGAFDPVRVVAVGSMRDVLFDPTEAGAPNSPEFDRQLRAFGSPGQETLQRLRVAIVGLGGTGSIVAEQLAHLGVRDFMLLDPDVVELTNLNRLAGATLDDIGRPKVEIAARHIRSIQKQANVTTIVGDVIKARTALQLRDADLIFGCTDSHGSRAVLQQISYQYLIPCIDMGVTIAVVDGRITHIYGRVQLLAPGLACLTCGGLLDSNEVRRDMMTAFERQADPYLRGVREPAPAVMSLNGTVSSLSVTMLLAVVVGVPMNGRHILYDAMASALRVVKAIPQPNCFVCSRSGSLARADAWPVLARQD